MHAARKALQKISRSAKLRGNFNVLFSKRRAAGHHPQSSTLKNIISRNIAGWIGTRSSVLSQSPARDFGTSTRKEPPESRGIPVFGTILSLAMAGGAQKLHEYVDKRHRELGSIYREQIGPVRAVFVNSPEEFRRIFLRLEGPMPQHFLPESWKLYNEIRAQRRGLLFMYVFLENLNSILDAISTVIAPRKFVIKVK